jgi:hypothetical protein
MGYDAGCTLRLDGRRITGKALLEQHELIVRGAERVVIPIKEVTSATAKDGTLTIRFGRKTAVLDLGPVADRWATRIMNPPSRLDKLGAKAGMSALIAGTRHADLVEELNTRGRQGDRARWRLSGFDFLWRRIPRRAGTAEGSATHIET